MKDVMWLESQRRVTERDLEASEESVRATAENAALGENWAKPSVSAVQDTQSPAGTSHWKSVAETIRYVEYGIKLFAEISSLSHKEPEANDWCLIMFCSTNQQINDINAAL